MKPIARVVVLAVAPLLMAAIWMDRQQSYKPYREPAPATPAGIVPYTGREAVSQDNELRNPVAATTQSLERGKAHFTINCVMCHGQTSAKPGPVGQKLTPPPPGLDHGLVQGLSDATIFNAITLGFGRMPPFRDKLSPHERWDVVNFLRTRK
jgi:mono/diheme cytochrome c family protein